MQAGSQIEQQYKSSGSPCVRHQLVEAVLGAEAEKEAEETAEAEEVEAENADKAEETEKTEIKETA